MIRNLYSHLRWPSPDVRRGAIRSTLFAGAMLLVSCRGGVEADNVDTAVAASGRLAKVATLAPAAIQPPAAAGPSFLGLNLTSQTYYGGEHVYSNLLVGTSWVNEGAGWSNVDSTLYFNSAGKVTSLPAGGLNKILTPPLSLLAGSSVTIRCTWTGTGTIVIGGQKSADYAGDHSYEFKWSDVKTNSTVWLSLRSSSASNPVGDLDCREKGTTGGLFSPEYVSYLKPFGVLRFMDWGFTNDNAALRWATRTMPTDLAQTTSKGAALEHIIALTNEVGADAWVNVPWNGDADYVRRMAQLLHDGIPANRRIYVELSNEVWNPAFVVFHQAWKEGLAEGLSDNAFQATMRRYAERTTEVMKIWTQVFADRPGQLVRVAATQDANAWVLQQILEFKDTANWVDAVASAPYFGHSFFDGPRAAETDMTKLLADLSGLADTELNVYVPENLAVAKQYGKRMIAYEAGQHVLSPGNNTRLEQLNRDPRMYDIYKKYLLAWKAKVNDTMVLFNATGSISQYGAWGIREYAGQPLAQTPKLRAALDVIAGKK